MAFSTQHAELSDLDNHNRNHAPPFFRLWKSKKSDNMKPAVFLILGLALLWSCGQGPDQDEPIPSEVPKSLGLDEFYKKYRDAGGIPVVASEDVPDEALERAKEIALHMLSKRLDIREQLVSNKLRIGVMGRNEVTTDIPEHRDLNTVFPGTDWDTRARGLGATVQRPVSTCAEENLLCYSSDVFAGEDIMVHEFAHSIHLLGISFLEPDFNDKLEALYQQAKDNATWENTYANTNKEEYWAEGVQGWFNVNLESIPSNGIHNHVNTRAELQEADPGLFNLISQYFPDDDTAVSCHTPD